MDVLTCPKCNQPSLELEDCYDIEFVGDYLVIAKHYGTCFLCKTTFFWNEYFEKNPDMTILRKETNNE